MNINRSTSTWAYKCWKWIQMAFRLKSPAKDAFPKLVRQVLQKAGRRKHSKKGILLKTLGTGHWKRTKDIIGFWRSITHISWWSICVGWTRSSKQWPCSLGHAKLSSAEATTKKCRRNIIILLVKFWYTCADCTIVRRMNCYWRMILRGTKLKSMRRSWRSRNYFNWCLLVLAQLQPRFL